MMKHVVKSVIDAIRTSAATRRLTVLRLRSDIRSTRARQRRALAHHHVARRAWSRAVRTALRRHRAAALASLRADIASATAPPSDAPAEPLQTRVLRVIESHPEGVRPLDVGNELGVDWRGVLEAARDLVDAGAVERVDRELYPAKASRKW